MRILPFCEDQSRYDKFNQIKLVISKWNGFCHEVNASNGVLCLAAEIRAKQLVAAIGVARHGAAA